MFPTEGAAARDEALCNGATMDCSNRSAFFVSSKLGDGVELLFHKVAADLCEIPLSNAQETSYQKPLKAEIVNHARNDPEFPVVNATKRESKKQCVVM
mmetsp:Transcript_10857/g.26629  ORF Transcript_10857/g.26629 Transcript_10857/m.26629 type:complete len:98 (-) Transcript_10857:120-413(-)